MNTAQILEMTADMINISDELGLNSESKRRWTNAIEVIRNEVLLSQAEKFRRDVMEIAKEVIGEFVTPQDVVTIMSDKTPDSRKKETVWVNKDRKGFNKESAVAMKEVLTQRLQSSAIAVCQYTLDGKFVKEWASITKAAKSIGVCAGSISSAISGRTHSSGGYIWKRKDDDTPVIPCIHKICNYAKPVGQYNSAGKLINSFTSISAAAQSISVCNTTLCSVLDKNKSLKGYKWKSLDTTK